MSSRDSVGSSSDSSCSSRSSYASSSGSFPSIASTISSIFSRRSTPLPELPTSSLQSPQDKAIENVSNVTYFESKSRRDKSYGDNTSTYLVNVCSNEPLNHQIPTRQKLLTTAQNGPSALARLQDVQNVFCVAFGIFDRYYVAWKDTRGEKHQVSFGTNNEFFASDKDDKISGRDSVPSTIDHVSRSSLIKPIVQINSHLIPNHNKIEEETAEILRNLRLKRRSTMFTLDYQRMTLHKT
ncbi:uncharacterized protein EAF02_011029 [Botrytis sinoallii]|uniref:uncharacterized protein n=1 Tax=Botrytis sinoallii TaxID=1463999 RepID=UPI0019025B71|nr:uncharacterized protein EAF02_011029 [Botrytis sinoallii]KAF7858705.1 hypothetical protein EAF02_011029 [Botrytis sinoallii]